MTGPSTDARRSRENTMSLSPEATFAALAEEVYQRSPIDVPLTYANIVLSGVQLSSFVLNQDYHLI